MAVVVVVMVSACLLYHKLVFDVNDDPDLCIDGDSDSDLCSDGS